MTTSTVACCDKQKRESNMRTLVLRHTFFGFPNARSRRIPELPLTHFFQTATRSKNDTEPGQSARVSVLSCLLSRIMHGRLKHSERLRGTPLPGEARHVRATRFHQASGPSLIVNDPPHGVRPSLQINRIQ